MEVSSDVNLLKIEELTKDLEFADKKNEELLGRVREYEQVIENQRKEIELLRANLEFAMGKNETNDSLLGGPTNQEILEEDARQQMNYEEVAGKESENAQKFL